MGSLHPHRPSVHENRSGLPWYAATNLVQAEAVRLGRVSELGLVWPAECWFVELAGLAFAGTKQVWLMNASRGVAPALL
jgi:hypothetical protein